MTYFTVSWKKHPPPPQAQHVRTSLLLGWWGCKNTKLNQLCYPSQWVKNTKLNQPCYPSQRVKMSDLTQDAICKMHVQRPMWASIGMDASQLASCSQKRCHWLHDHWSSHGGCLHRHKSLCWLSCLWVSGDLWWCSCSHCCRQSSFSGRKADRSDTPFRVQCRGVHLG